MLGVGGTGLLNLKTVQSITFGSAPAIVAGDTGTVSATASSGLSVSYSSNTTGVCTVVGSAVTGVTAGTCVVGADQAGDATYAPAVQVTQSFAVGRRNSVSANVTSLNPSNFGQSVNFTATVTGQNPTGTVNFKDGATTIPGCGVVALNSGQAQCTVSTLGVATHSVTATYGGDSNNTNSTSSALSQVVNPASTTTGLASSSNPSSFGQNVTFTATVAGQSPTGTVNFKDGATTIPSCGVAALTGGQAQCTTSALVATAHMVTAIYSGDSNNAASTSGPLNQVIDKAITTLIFAPQTAAAQLFVVSGAFSISPLAVGSPSTAPVIYGVSPAQVCSVNGTVVTMIAAGDCAITANQGGDLNYEPVNPIVRTVVLVTATLDIDQSGTGLEQYQASTDGLLIVRYLRGHTGASLADKAVASTATRTDPLAIKNYLDVIRAKLDVDGNGQVDAATDGRLILRYLAGFRGNALIAGALPTTPPLAIRSAAEIESYLQALLP